MNHFVPEFNMGDQDYSPPALPGQNNVQEEAIMELLWRNGQVVVQSQNQRLLNQSSKSPGQVSMHEEEMISWLQCPLEDSPYGRDLNDLLYHPPPAPVVLPNFPHFSRVTTDRIPDSRHTEVRESTVVDSCDTPAVDRESNINLPRMNTIEVHSGGNRGWDSFSGTVGGTSTLGGGCMSISMSRDGDTMLTSSPEGSSATDTTAPDRKRKGREPVDDATTEYQSEDVEIESYEEKKQASRGNAKRSRAAEVHNLSERRRRDKINEKMKALQDLIPRCSKTDKASMLDEAIEYLKSLQMQVQMMAMGCGMVPMMFPGAQRYMPTMGMGIGMGMGMGMTRPMIPYPAVLSGSCLPTPGAPSQMNPRFPPQVYPVPPVQQPSIQGDASAYPVGMPGHNVARTPNLAEPYQQYIGVQNMPMQIPETQPTSQPGTGQESTGSGDQDDEKHQSG